eukprot:4907217-Alexandrium_andersonii.AAC.1
MAHWAAPGRPRALHHQAARARRTPAAPEDCPKVVVAEGPAQPPSPQAEPLNPQGAPPLPDSHRQAPTGGAGRAPGAA